MGDEIGSKYTAFSEDAMAEQIAQLTAICNQQANAIQNLSLSIAQLSANRYGPGQYTDSGVPSGSNSVVYGSPAAMPHSFQKSKVSASGGVSTGRQVRIFPVTASKEATPPTGNGSGAKRSGSAMYIPGFKQGESNAKRISSQKRSKVENGASSNQWHMEDPQEDDSGEAHEEGKAGNPTALYNQLDEEAQGAKEKVLSLLQSLRDNYSFEQCINVVRARLCGEWIAVRPEELLSKLRDAQLEAPSRKDLIRTVLAIGSAIVRGRSVKFGRDTRRAIAIPRKYFTPHELGIVDNCFWLRTMKNEDDGDFDAEKEYDETGVDDDEDND